MAKGNPADLGVSVLSSNGKQYRAGNWDKCFSIQSVVKPILLLLALLDNGEAEVRAHVGVEATGRPFDAINVTDQLLSSNHLNPMVNMGAIKMCTLIHGKTYEERFQRLLELTRLLAGNKEIEVDESVYTSEKQTGSKNRALAYLLQSNGLLNDNVEEVLDCYFKCCSIRVNSMDLANIGFVLANRGRLPHTEERVFPVRFAHYVNAIMVTCGMYNGSGEFAIQVGVPAKSGVAAASWPLSRPAWASGSSVRRWTARETASRGSACWSACRRSCTSAYFEATPHNCVYALRRIFSANSVV